MIQMQKFFFLSQHFFHVVISIGTWKCQCLCFNILQILILYLTDSGYNTFPRNRMCEIILFYFIFFYCNASGYPFWYLVHIKSLFYCIAKPHFDVSIRQRKKNWARCKLMQWLLLLLVQLIDAMQFLCMQLSLSFSHSNSLLLNLGKVKVRCTCKSVEMQTLSTNLNIYMRWRRSLL